MAQKLNPNQLNRHSKIYLQKSTGFQVNKNEESIGFPNDQQNAFGLGKVRAFTKPEIGPRWGVGGSANPRRLDHV